jgi:hypothetical protein
VNGVSEEFPTATSVRPLNKKAKLEWLFVILAIQLSL